MSFPGSCSSATQAGHEAEARRGGQRPGGEDERGPTTAIPGACSLTPLRFNVSLPMGRPGGRRRAYRQESANEFIFVVAGKLL